MEASLYYDQFLEEQKQSLNLYERAALWAYKLLKINWENAEFDHEMEEVEIFIRYKHAVNLALLVGILTLPISASIFLIGKNSITNGIAMIMPLLFGFFAGYFPMYLAKLRKLKILGQAPLALLYLVIAMEVTPNLESSVAFAAKNMPNPMGQIFKYLLWLVETRKMPNMEEALSWYSNKIKDWAPHVSEGIYLISGSMKEVGEMRTRTLEKSVTTVLNGTKNMMEGFARGLDMPVMATNAFGIMLPVLMLVMLPIMSVFVSTTNVGPALFLIYDFALPVILLLIIVSILGKRPGTLNEIKYKQNKFKLKMFGKTRNIFPFMILSSSLFVLIQILVVISIPSVFSPIISGTTAASSVSTVSIILAGGIPVGLYFLSWAQENQEIKRKVNSLEKEFAGGLYQLGNIMSQGLPIEQAMGEVSTRMKGSETEVFFSTVTSRMKTLGWPLDRVLFDEKYGVMNAFPSNLIRNIMLVIMRSAEKGPKSASMTAVSVSRYLGVMQDVKDKITDLLAESISSIKFQGMILIPIITGTIVGLGEITSNLLLTIGGQITSITQMGAVGGSSFVSDFLNIEGALQPSFLQLVVGIYVLLSCVVLGLFVGGLEEGWDKMSIFANIGQLVLFGSIIYVITTTLVAVLFGGLASTVI